MFSFTVDNSDTFLLGLARKLNDLIQSGEYEEAKRVADTIIDEYEAKNPFYFYQRAKCMYHIGATYLLNIREDVYKAIKQLSKINNDQAQIMAIRVQYLAGMVEYDFGSDMKRSYHHFSEFVETTKHVDKYILKRNMPDVGTLAKSVETYME